MKSVPHAIRTRTQQRVPTKGPPSGVLPPQDQPAAADRDRDVRLQKELTERAGDTTAARHRDAQTAIESDEDAVPEDEQALDAAAAIEADARRARSRQPRADA